MPALLVLSIFLLAVLANSLLGIHLTASDGPMTDAEKQWHQELSALRLEERHPYC
jgi:hypothetical protein